MNRGGGRHQPGLQKSGPVLTLAVLLLWGGTASADPQAAPVVLCKGSLPCLQQMVDDLRSYREYLEDQLSLAKSLLNAANQRVSQQAKELEALKKAGEAPGQTKPLPAAPGKQ